MAFEPVDSARHAGLRIGQGLATRDLAALGHIQIACWEIAAAACDFPLVFLKDAQTGQFRLVALMGFDGRRNLYASERGWHATYLPHAIERQPFAWTPGTDARLELAIDTNHPRVGDPEGALLFDAGGRESAFLTARRQIMTQMIEDARLTDTAIAAWTVLDLIQPFPIVLTYADRREERVEGLYTIGASRLAALADKDVPALYRDGHLAFAYGIVQSTGQFNRLQQMHAAHAAHDAAFARLDSVVIGVPD